MKNVFAGVAIIAMSAVAGPAQAAETIRMMAPTWLGFAPVHVANDLGCFAKRASRWTTSSRMTAPTL